MLTLFSAETFSIDIFILVFENLARLSVWGSLVANETSLEFNRTN